MKYDVTKGGYILLGRCGENLARTVEIDVSEYLVEYPGAVVTLLHRRHGESGIYPVAAELRDGCLVWQPTSADTAIVGDGEAEVRVTVNGVLAKSKILSTVVDKSLTGQETDVPEASKGWVDAVISAVSNVQNMKAEAESVAYGEPATAEYDGTTGTMHFGIPEGRPGRDGTDGKDGAAGAKGDPGSDANVTAQNITSALGYTPADKVVVDQLSDENEELKEEKAEQKDFDLLVESVAIEHPGSNNLYNVETSTIGLLNVQGSINTGETNYYTSDYIRVQGGNTLYFAQVGIPVMVACVAFYSDKDTNITGGVTWVKTADVPENAKYCRVCVSSGVNNNFAVNIGEIKPYDDYKDKSYEYKNQKDFDNIKSAISGIQKGWLCASLNNQIKNGNFENTSGWTPSGGTISVSENTLTVTGNGTRDTISATSITQVDIGRKHFAFAYVRTRNDSCQKIEMNGIGGYVSIPVIKPQMDKWYPIGFVDYGHASSMQNCFSIRAYYNSSDEANGQAVEIKETMLIDITDDFGLGDNVRLHKMMAIVMENGWWNGEKHVKIEKLSVRQINNAENCYLLTAQTSYQAIKRPLVTFVNDDGWQDDFTKLSYISEKYNVPFVSAIFNGSTMNQWAMWYLQEHLGWEFAAHPRNTALAELQTEAEIKQAMLETNEYMTQYGLICHNLVYPYGSHDERVRRIAKKYYHCACTTDPNGRNEKVVASYALHRHPIGYGASDNSLERLKSKVDEAVENNAWLIFMLHPHMVEHTEELNQTIDDLIAYIKSICVDIVTLNDGYCVFGNALECGDYIGGDTGIAIGYDGARANI